MDFKGEEGNSQVDEKDQTCGEPILAGPPETMGRRGESTKQASLDISLPATLSSYSQGDYAKVNC